MPKMDQCLILCRLRSFRMLQAVSSVAGAWTGSTIRQSDWTRYARTKRAPVLNQLITLPLALSITAMLGIFATSAVNNMYGTQIWQPITLLEFLLVNNYNAATRAGCFFAGVGFFWNQIAVSTGENGCKEGFANLALGQSHAELGGRRYGSCIHCSEVD
jgi:NCS1 family nucleobase:cation symporter-1